MCLHVIFVTTSRGCSVQTIEEYILKKLRIPEGGNVECQRQIIYEFLKIRSFLILLDDLWEQIDLQAVGVPYPLGIVNQLERKVVLTTRLRKVCGEMEVSEVLKVACLQETDAWQLFKEKVSEETLSSSPRIETLARELVKELKGLPLALIVIGKAMYPKTDPIEWEYAIQHMHRSCCIKDNPLSLENVFGQHKFSYDNLRNDTLKHCFLTCALWPEDWEIIKADLDQCCIGLVLVDECDIRRSYTKAYSIIGDLRDACLLENWGNWYGFVKVHDVIRGMALWISCGYGDDNNKWFIRAEAGAEESISIPWSKPEYISLMLNGMKKLPPFGFDHRPMKLTVLCLQHNYFDGSIAETVKNFTSLTYLDLRTNLLKNICEELCSLANLEYFDLSHNPNICELPHYFRNLTKLKFLYLLCTIIRRVPEEVISNLKALQVIDLRTCRAYVGGGPVNFIPNIFQELGTLDHFKAAGIEADGFDEYETLREAAKLPIRSLRLGSLKRTHEFGLSDILSIKFARRTLYELDIIQSNMEQIIVRDESSYHFGALNKLLLWFLVNLRGLRWLGRSPTSIFPKLTCLDVNSCSKLENLSWVMYVPCLEHLEVRFSNIMAEAFPGTEHHGEIMSMDQESSMKSNGTFSCLKYLHLSDNPKLVTIYDDNVMFPFLEQLVLTKSPELIRLPFRMHRLPLKLQELQFYDVECWDRLECDEGVKYFL
uniref:Uncharacterized protein n=1 Tax=Triticum aestivum TaxID=4565 RepID=A0A077RZM1_WHEAT|nr:unnamed protein product [Triticum aestivum]